MHLGQEIYTFFNIYGINGLLGLVLSMSFIGIIIYKTFKIVLENNIETYQDFIMHIMPNKLKNNNVLVFTINNIINISDLLFICYIGIKAFIK